MRMIDLFPSWFGNVPVITQLADVMDQVWNEQVTRPAALMADIRNLQPDTEREILRRTVSMIGYNDRHNMFDQARLYRLATHLPKFRLQSSTEVYKAFLSFLLNHPVEVDNCWTEDYIAFFAVPEGPLLLDGLGNRLDEEVTGQFGWYPTTHVILRCRPSTLFPNSTTPYRDMLDLFYKLAPAYVVVEHIGAVADMMQARLELNLGVIEGYSWKQHLSVYEQMEQTGDWVLGRQLPAPLQQHSAQAIGTTSYLIGGYSGDIRNENTNIAVKKGGLDYEIVDPLFRTGTDITAACSSNTLVLLGNSIGELSASRNRGLTWEKLWSPFININVPIVALAYNTEQEKWLAASRDGSVVISPDGINWTGAVYKTTPLTGGFYGNGFFCLLPQANGSVLRSVDGVKWSGSVVSPEPLKAGIYHQTLDQYMVLGTCGRAWVSSDLTNWSQINIGLGEYELTGIYYCGCSDLTAVYGPNALFSYSKDLRQWVTPDTLFRTSDIEAVILIPWIEQFLLLGGTDNKASRGFGQDWSLYRYPVSPTNRTKEVRVPKFTERVITREIPPPEPKCEPWMSEYDCQKYLYSIQHLRGKPTIVTETIRDEFVETTTVTEQIKGIIRGGIAIGRGGQSHILIYGTNNLLQIIRTKEIFLKKSSMTQPRAGHTTFTYDRRYIYAVGGSSYNQILDSVEMYDSQTDTWVSKSPLPMALSTAGATTVTTTTDNWAIRNPKFGAQNINNVSYSSNLGKFIAVGSRGKISTSDYGIYWTESASPFPVQNVIAATYNANVDEFIIFSNQSPSAFSSATSSIDRGLTWNAKDISWPGGRIMSVASYIDRQPFEIIMGGIHRPVDGTRPDVPLAVRLTQNRWVVDDIASVVSSSKSIYCGYYSEKYQYFIAGVDGGVVTSRDGGKTWTYHRFQETRDAYTGRMPCLAVAEVQGRIVAIRSDGHRFVSLDGGVHWTDTVFYNDPLPDLSPYMLWDLEEWAAADFDLPRSVSIAVSPNQLTFAMITPNGALLFSDDLGTTFSLQQPAPGTEPIIRKARYNPYVDILTTQLAWTTGTRLYVSLDNGVTIDHSIIIEAQNYAEERAIGLCPLSEDEWLVGGARLWYVNIQPFLDFSEVQEILIRMPAGPELTGNYVSGTLQQQLAQYQLTCLDDVGEGRPSPVFAIDIPASTDGVGVSLSWTRIPQAKAYRLYGRRQGAMFLLAELSADATNFVDDGTTALRLTSRIPSRDTSGLMGMQGAALQIVDIKFSTSTNRYYVATVDGAVAWSSDRENWYGVQNPAPVAEFTISQTITKGGENVVIKGGSSAITGYIEPNPTLLVSETSTGARTFQASSVTNTTATTFMAADSVQATAANQASADVFIPASTAAAPATGTVKGGGTGTVNTGTGPLLGPPDEILPVDLIDPIDDNTGLIGAPVELINPYSGYVYGRGFVGVNELIIRESSSLYVVGGTLGAVGISKNGTDWTYEYLTGGTYTGLAYNGYTDRLVLHTATGEASVTFGNPALIPPHLDTGSSMPGGPLTALAPNILYHYAVVPIKNSQRGVQSNWLQVPHVTSTNKIQIILPVDQTRVNTVPEFYELWRYQVAAGSADTPALQGVIPIPPGVSSIVYEDHGSSTSVSQVFTGTGLDDLVWNDLGLTDASLLFRLEVLLVAVDASGDSIRWRMNGGTWSNAIIITGPGVPIVLNYGVTITFANITGHTERDTWSVFVIRPQPLTALPDINETAQDLGVAWQTVTTGFTAISMQTVDNLQPTGSQPVLEFMAVGPTGAIRSVDGINWFSIFNNALSNLYSVTSGIVGGKPVTLLGGNGVVYLVKSFTESPEAITLDMDGPVQSLMFSASQKIFIAAGQRSQIMTSLNAKNWTFRPVAEALGDITSLSTGDARLFRVLAVGTEGTVFSSFDGRAWVARDIGFSNGNINTCLVDETGTDETIIVAGDGGSILTSSDNGVIWTYRENNFSRRLQDIRCGIGVSGSIYLLAGASVIRSADSGDTWNDPAELPNLEGPPITQFAKSPSAVMFITLQGARTYVSFDQGERWARTSTVPQLSEGRGLAYGDGWWVAIGPDGRFAYSQNNGLSWTTTELSQAPYLDRIYTPDSLQKIDFTAVCFDGTHFILGGSQGDALRILPGSWTEQDSMDVRFFGHPIRCLLAADNTVIAGSHRGVMSTRFYGFEDTQYVCGGFDDFGPTNSLLSYVHTADTWVTNTAIPAARSGAAVVTLADQTVLVIGGVDGFGVPTKTTYRYLPHKDVWIEGPQLPYPKGWLTGHTLLNRWVCVMGAGIDPWYRTLFLSELVAPISVVWVKRMDGLLAAGTYSYRITAVIGAEQTVPTPISEITVGPESGVSLDWQPVAGATEYRIYGRGPGAVYLLGSVKSPRTSFIDSGLTSENQEQIVVAEGTMQEERWYETRERMPLPRETFASCILENGIIYCSGGGTDGRTWYFKPSEANIIRSQYDVLQDQIYTTPGYVEDGYVGGDD
jgi:photosystem II stability/assembly factor-like uncharacterized protein